MQESFPPPTSTAWHNWRHQVSAVLLGISTACVYYYCTRVCKKPKLVSGSLLHHFLTAHCPVVTKPFCPTFWCFSGRLQTVLRVILLSRPTVLYRNEVICTEDGGQISLDWADNDSSSTYPDATTRPTVILLPGLTGNSQQTYILHLVRQACQDGYRCVVFNNRGFGGEELLTHRTFCAANTDDLDRVVYHVKGRLPASSLLAVGISLGGMMLLNYLAVRGSLSQLKAAIVFSTPWNVFESTRSLEEPLNYLLFNRTLVKGLRKTVCKYRTVIEKVLDVDYVLKSRSIREFDERYTSVVFGFPSCDEYYRQASPDHKLSSVQIPVLCVNAADDPFSPKHAIPITQVSSNPHVALLIPNHGGHIGFLEGFFPHHQTYMDRVFSQFMAAILQHGEKLRGLEKKDQVRNHREAERTEQDQVRVHREAERTEQDQVRDHREAERTEQDQVRVHREDERTEQDQVRVHREAERIRVGLSL